MSKSLLAFEEIYTQIYVSSENTKRIELIENELKALEIIKNKEINIHALLIHLKRFDSPEGYNVLVGEKYKLTQEEYELLKEVLLWNWKNILSGSIPKSWKGERERMAIPKNKTRLTITIHKESKHLLDELLALHNDSYSQVFEYALYFYAKTLLESFNKIEKQEKGEKENAKD